ADDGIRVFRVTGVQTCALPILPTSRPGPAGATDPGAPGGRRVPHLAIAAVAVAALAAALRLPALGEYWLNPDEGIYYSVIAWPDLARRQAEIAENAHPPFFYHLLWAWSRVSMEFAWLRALAALAGCVAVLAFLLL